MLRIGPFSKLGKTTVKTLHHYDEQGLLKPAHIDAQTGYRYYSTGQLHRLNEIVCLRQMGFSVPETRSMLDGRGVEQALEKKRRELTEQKREMGSRLDRLEHYIRQRKDGTHMEYQTTVKEISECTVFYYRTTLKKYEDLFGLVHKLMGILERTNPELTCVQPDYCFSVYLDGEYREEDIDLEFCQAVTGRGVEAEGVKFKTLPATRVVSVLHKGPYRTLGAAYAAVFSWMDANGFEAAGNPRESYIDGVWNKEEEQEWLTEIQVPIK
ncbi:MerR family transcriptional regulator [Ruminococcaceae bacterium OttesenSCG-928-I18]|nr:MerR family transcriptional regulator [Ruminococcaceae bacterium OttesenSCG-928-I18]